MARYDYRCTQCGRVFEVRHGMTERPEVFCPDCGAPCEKLFNATGIEFKGSGFYNTDQRGGSATSATMGSPEGAATAAPTASAGAGTEHHCENCPHKND